MAFHLRIPRLSCRGLTLTELVVVTGILGIVTGLVYEMFRYQSQTYARVTAQNVTQDDIRLWVARLVQDARRAGYDPLEVNDPDAAGLPVFGIQEWGSDTFRFTADVDGDGTLASGATENMGFRLDSSENRLELWQGGSNWRPVVFGVTDLSITYRDANDNVVATNRRDIRAVEITVAAETETAGYPGASPPVLSRTATAELRNPVY